MCIYVCAYLCAYKSVYVVMADMSTFPPQQVVNQILKRSNLARKVEVLGVSNVHANLKSPADHVTFDYRILAGSMLPDRSSDRERGRG